LEDLNNILSWIFKKRAKNQKNLVLFLSFVDDDLFISQEKSFGKTNSYLFCNYNIISSVMTLKLGSSYNLGKDLSKSER